ncbi:uncharacterized protein LOC134255443 [Saccostrea cucullata]|uniref:uncharacterized protein LOC134255443 n=1 Tax=Saccostrea cuccullata TaxID=36930 RepID=UPI002ED509A7
MCSGNRSVVCEDDPKAPCATLSSFGLCTHLQYNPDSEDIKFCPKTCNLCDKYCEYVLRTVPPATVSPPTFSKTTQRTTIPGVTGSVPITTQYPTLSPTSSQSQGLQCPSCDMNLTCVGYQTCSPEEVCMILPNPGSKFLTHCSMVI